MRENIIVKKKLVVLFSVLLITSCGGGGSGGGAAAFFLTVTSFSFSTDEDTAYQGNLTHSTNGSGSVTIQIDSFPDFLEWGTSRD